MAQSLDKAANDAFLISRMVEKFHVQPRPLDAAMSLALYTHLLDALDEQRIFFTKEDIGKLSAYKLKLDEEIRNRRSAFLQLLVNMYKIRLQQADTMTDNICQKPFDFTVKEKLTVAEDTSYPADLKSMHVKLNKMLKQVVLGAIIGSSDPASSASPPSRSFVDSLEPVLRKRADHTFKRFVKRLLQSPQGIEYIVGNIYCQSLASCYDPHTAYFPPDIKNAFESQLGNKPMEFGFSLNEDEDGNVEIGRLKPGSPAFQSGRLNEGDRMLSIQWDNKDSIDVSDASLSEVDHMLSASGGDRLTMTVRKSDGTIRRVTLHKAKVENDDDDNKVKGFVLRGSRSIGYISLPDFYADWEDNSGLNGCANDVAREIIKLKKENIQGLILDLRYNGGGSMQEAIELTGIFIDAGPLAQIKTREEKVITLKDVNRGTIYDGPLLVLVNGSSASASEMVAGSLQDYNRALIVGAATYGKATAQIVLPMDTSISLATYNGKADASAYIKVTTDKLFRVSGKTAQATSVIPDIVLPDPSDAVPEREADEPFAIPPSSIEPNKYYRPLAPLPLDAAREIAGKEIDSSAYFQQTIQYIKKMKQREQKKDSPLSLADAWQAMKEEGPGLLPPHAGEDSARSDFAVVNHAFEQRRIQGDSDLREANEETRNVLQKDPYVQVAYHVLAGIIK